MPTYYVKKPAGHKAAPEENWLIWFSGKGIDECSNALLLYGTGEIHLLKTSRVVSRAELDTLDFENWSADDYEKWNEFFGTDSASNELREAYRHFREVNS